MFRERQRPDQTLLLLCECSTKLFNSRNFKCQRKERKRSTRHIDAWSRLCDCPWKVGFKKQLNDSWILAQLVDEHQ
ncbi:hypothetical protein V1507DRAFT_469659 [Lipomyces tetrasporus]